MDKRTHNTPSEMEKAERSREDSNLGAPNPGELGHDAGPPMERGAGQQSKPEKPLEPREKRGGGTGTSAGQDRPAPRDSDDAGGITNRPLGEEEQNQEELPPRGKSRKGGTS